MISPRLLSGCLLLVAIAAGTFSDVPNQKHPATMGGYHVLAADFHVHTFPLSASTLAPWDVVLEAQRQGLDAIAITGHDQVLAGKIGQWFSRRVGGPTVLVGEEIISPHYHLVAVGIHTTISWRRSAAAAIDEVHQQGGIAIAAHPVAEFWPAFVAEAMTKLDATEVLQPIAYSTRLSWTRAPGSMPHLRVRAGGYRTGNSRRSAPGPHRGVRQQKRAGLWRSGTDPTRRCFGGIDRDRPRTVEPRTPRCSQPHVRHSWPAWGYHLQFL
jgi:hypothetical protein